MREGYEGERGRHVIQDKEARDSGQLLHFADFFVSLHCVRRKAALGKVQASLTLLAFRRGLRLVFGRTAFGDAFNTDATISSRRFYAQ